LGINTTFPQLFPTDPTTESATVVFSFDNLTIRAGEVAVVNVTFSFPSTVDSKRIPIISGYINIESSENESFHLPYGGVACNMKEVKITDFERGPPHVSRSSDLTAKSTSIDKNAVFNLASEIVWFEWRLLLGSSIVRLDILGNGTQTEAIGVNILGSIPNYPSYFMSRNSLISLASSYSVRWNGSLSNGAQLPNGDYKIFYRALKLFGDPNNNNDYENYTSPLISITNGTLIVSTSSASTTTTTTVSTLTSTTKTTTGSTSTTTSVTVTGSSIDSTDTTSPVNRSQHSVASSVELSIFLIVTFFVKFS